MRYSVNNYVKAFSELLKEAPANRHENISASFIKLLQKTGDIKHKEKIIEAIHKKLVNEKGGKWIDVEVARESASKKGMLKNKFSDKDHLNFKINPELVAGMRITVNGEEELDNTLQNKLNKLFK